MSIFAPIFAPSPSISPSPEAEPGKWTAAIAHDVSDVLFYAAIAMLPVDGTRVGISLPYWTPISPWLFLLYVAANWRLMRVVLRRYLPLFVFPLLLVATSLYGWKTIGMNPVPIAKSFVSVLLGLCCLASLEIALRCKRLRVRGVVTVLVAAYWFAFAVGVLEYLSLRSVFDWGHVRGYFYALLYRYQYLYTRPQFLFAEPSYIGMHLFGVLLPAYWMTRDRRLIVLIPVFAVGAIAMGAGTRIVLDSIVAVLVCLLVGVNFRSFKATAAFVAGLGTVCAGGLAAVALNPRLNALATDGLLAGDGSMSARIFHALAPMWSWKHDVGHLMFGWGAGNIADAVRTGYAGARRWYDAHGGLGNAEIDGLANPPADTFTMSAYASFITEYGLVCFVLLLAMVAVFVTLNRAWSRRTVCWLLLLVYLYLQFESYAFYAVPLFVWSICKSKFQ